MPQVAPPPVVGPCLVGDLVLAVGVPDDGRGGVGLDDQILSQVLRLVQRLKGGGLVRVANRDQLSHAVFSSSWWMVDQEIGSQPSPGRRPNRVNRFHPPWIRTVGRKRAQWRTARTANGP
jgi:hypothetical protein